MWCYSERAYLGTRTVYLHQPDILLTSCKRGSEDQHSLNIVTRDMDSKVLNNSLFGTQLLIPRVECGAKAPEYRTVWYKECRAVQHLSLTAAVRDDHIATVKKDGSQLLP